jgi:hypothetical protein
MNAKEMSESRPDDNEGEAAAALHWTKEGLVCDL